MIYQGFITISIVMDQISKSSCKPVAISCGFGAGEFGQTFTSDWTWPIRGAEERLEKVCSDWAIEKNTMLIAGHPNCINTDEFSLRELEFNRLQNALQSGQTRR